MFEWRAGVGDRRGREKGVQRELTSYDREQAQRRGRTRDTLNSCFRVFFIPFYFILFCGFRLQRNVTLRFCFAEFIYSGFPSCLYFLIIRPTM